MPDNIIYREETPTSPGDYQNQPASERSSSINVLMIIGVIVVLILVVSVGAYFLFNPNKGSGGNSGETSGDGKTSLADIFKDKKNVTCTVKYEEGEGKLYISDTKYYGEYYNTIDGQTKKAYTVSDGEYTYIWAEGETEGLKAKLTKEQREDVPSVGDLENEEGEVNCTNDAPDPTKFTPPSNINFFDVTPAEPITQDQEN